MFFSTAQSNSLKRRTDCSQKVVCQMFNVNRNVRCLFLKCGDLRMCSTIRSSLGGQVWLEWTIIHLKRGTSRLLLPYMVACLICCITVKIKHASLLFLVDTTITYGHHFLRIAGRQRLNIARKALFYIFLNTCICCTFINDCWLLHLNVSLNRQLNLGLKRKLNIVPPN